MNHYNIPASAYRPYLLGFQAVPAYNANMSDIDNRDLKQSKTEYES